MKTQEKHFGKISAIILFFTIVVVNYNLLNVSNFKPYLNLSGLLFTGILMLFFAAQYYFKSKPKVLFKMGLLIVLLNLQIVFITHFLNSVELDNTGAEISMMDQRAALSISWLVIWPIVFLLFIILGSVFDYIAAITRGKNRT